MFQLSGDRTVTDLVLGGICCWITVSMGEVSKDCRGSRPCPLWHYYSFLEWRTSSGVSSPIFQCTEVGYIFAVSQAESRDFTDSRMGGGGVVGFLWSLSFQYLFCDLRPAWCFKQPGWIVFVPASWWKTFYLKCLRLLQDLRRVHRHKDALVSVSACYPMTLRPRVNCLSFVFMGPRVSLSFSQHFHAWDHFPSAFYLIFYVSSVFWLELGGIFHFVSKSGGMSHHRLRFPTARDVR